MTGLLQIFVTDIHHEISFASSYFILLFLPLALTLTVCGSKISPKFATTTLIGVSLGFYVSWGVEALAILVASIVINFSFRSWLIRENEQGHGKIARSLLLIIILLNVGLLIGFKYIHLLMSSLKGNFLQPPPATWIPLGISFYTFQEVTLAVDAFKGKYHKSFLKYVAFISFFPHLIAGPLLHHSELVPQMGKIAVRASNISLGISIFTVGLFKKICLADSLAPFVVRVFDSSGAPTFVDAWLGSLAYGMQLYFDFSGYSDMAIGLGFLFNVKLPVNFFSPYKAVNIADFWRRWHMTLSRFLREYIYYPLGGNRKGKIRRYGNVFLVMLIGGAWHGANWTFVLWGVLHGFMLLVNHAWRDWRELALPGTKSAKHWVVVSRGLTFMLVIFAWVPFRAHSITRTLEIWSAMLSRPSHTAYFVYEFPYVMCLLLLLATASQIAPNTAEYFLSGRERMFGYPETASRITWRPQVGTGIVVGITLAFCISLSMKAGPIFLYWNF